MVNTHLNKILSNAKEIEIIYNKFVEMLTKKINFTHKNHFKYNAYLKDKIYVLLDENNGVVSVQEIINVIHWYASRTNVLIVKGFNVEEMLKELKDFKLCGVQIDMYMDFNVDMEITYEIGYKFNLNMLENNEDEWRKIKKLEKKAADLFNYTSNSRLSQGTPDIWQINLFYRMKEKALKEFLSKRVNVFKAKWSDVITEKQIEAKRLYIESLIELEDELEKGNYGWLRK
ncbi:hypothetical protein [Priestia aryabhattai]